MKSVKINIVGYIRVPDEATEKDIEEAVEFNVGLRCQIASENPVGDSPNWENGWANVGL
ncbi:MAG: hypothetical protein IKZ87_04865 [Actinomycetaceae bacterium]|nr:hypothetical protein [Actinomycetaceae bacterium]